MNDEPLVSVILPIYNPDEGWLEESVQSILNQSYKNIEIILVNDGSEKSLDSYLEPNILDDEKIRTFNQDNQGFTGATNTAMEKASGKFVAPIGDDDIWKNAKLERQINEMNPKDKFCFTRAEIIDDNGKVISSSDFPKKKSLLKNLLKRNFIRYETALIDRKMLEERGYLDTSYDICSDYDLWLSSLTEENYTYIDESLVQKRSHKNNISRTSKKLVEEGEKVRRENIQDDEMLEKSLSIFFRHRGKGFFKSGETELARENWEKSLEQDFSFETLGLLMISRFPLHYDLIAKSYRTLNRCRNNLSLKKL